MHEHDSSVGASHLQHHFDTPAQQFSSAKLGMWLFLATEILLFGGLFCAYAVYRGNHPEVFMWAHHLLDSKLGAINTVVLLTSSLTMAWAVRCAQLNQRRGVIVLLALTLLGGFGFMTIKYIEYSSKWKHGLLWGTNFQPDEHYVAAHFSGGHDDAVDEGGPGGEEHDPDVALGQQLFESTCYSCHGLKGEGLAKLGQSLRASAFVKGKTDEELLTFLKSGRQPFGSDSQMHMLMPPRGGNPMLTDDKLVHVVAYLRVLQENWTKEAPAGGDSAAAVPEPLIASAVAPVVVQRSTIPRAADSPPGLMSGVGTHTAPLAQPHNVQVFFGIYFLMTGLHGIHVLAGMAILGWLLIRAIRSEFSSAYFTPVELGGLYWHLVDLIWIFLFPLLYLIH